MAHIPKTLRRRVMSTAKYRCGYCLTSQLLSGAQMHIEHIIAQSQGGTSDEANLWLSCAWCNSYKGAQVTGADPATGAIIALFNPRTQSWHDHFAWSDDGLYIAGTSATGRATVEALRLNNEFIVPARRQWKLAGWHPPLDEETKH
ncbi:MAG: HNH endonuclease signature motif containing protein [Anaerolineae bacterium]